VSQNPQPPQVRSCGESAASLLEAQAAAHSGDGGREQRGAEMAARRGRDMVVAAFRRPNAPPVPGRHRPNRSAGVWLSTIGGRGRLSPWAEQLGPFTTDPLDAANGRQRQLRGVQAAGMISDYDPILIDVPDVKGI
jgi:hypothetical protein